MESLASSVRIEKQLSCAAAAKSPSAAAADILIYGTTAAAAGMLRLSARSAFTIPR